MKLVFILTTIAPNILTLNGLHDSAKSAGGINITYVNSRTKDKSATGAIDQGASDVTHPSFDSVDGTASGNVAIVFGVEKDPTHIGNITKNIDNSLNDSNDNNINSRRKDKSAIGVIDHAVSDLMQPNCDGNNGNDTVSIDTISVTGVEKNPVNISSVNKNVDNSMNDNSDNKVSVIIIDFGLEPPSNASHVTYNTKGCGVGPVDGLAIRKQSCISGSSDADSFVFALSL